MHSFAAVIDAIQPVANYHGIVALSAIGRRFLPFVRSHRDRYKGYLRAIKRRTGRDDQWQHDLALNFGEHTFPVVTLAFRGFRKGFHV